MLLSREVRFFRSESTNFGSSAGENHWAGTSPSCSLPFWVVRIKVQGPVCPKTGYLCDIKWLDELVRSSAAPRFFALPPPMTLESVEPAAECVFREITARLPAPLGLIRLDVELSPYTSVALQQGPTLMLERTQSFEFSASHRLACPGLTDEENHRLFGKCSNPHGHGHNYILEVTIASSLKENRGCNSTNLDSLVKGLVIDRYDHRNLNVECDEFARLNPTVENIAQVIFDRLFEALGDSLLRVRVWETPKTSAECTSASEPAERLIR